MRMKGCIFNKITGNKLYLKSEQEVIDLLSNGNVQSKYQDSIRKDG